MTTTLVSGRRVRKGGSDVYADLLPEGVRLIGFPPDGLLFDGVLSDEQASAIRDRMESTDDADQARRAELRTLRDAVVAAPTLENVAALQVANTNYALGDE